MAETEEHNGGEMWNYRKKDEAPVTGVLGTTFGGTALGALAVGALATYLKNANGNKTGDVISALSLAANGAIGNKEVLELRGEVARLVAEKYTDGHILEVSKNISVVDEKLRGVDEKLAAAIAQNKADIETNFLLSQKNLEIAKLESKNDTLQMEARINAKIDAVATAGAQTAGAVSYLQQVVNGITKIVVPSAAVCNTGNGCGNNVQQ